jgi:membrane fusion protein, multidrug efflux system
MQVRTWVLCLAGCSLMVTGCSRKEVTASASQDPGAPVRVATVETRMVPVEIKAVGNVEPYSTITVKSQITGNLDKVYFKEGDFVKQGDVLFEIDPRPYEEALRQVQAAQLRDTALLRQAEANRERDRSMADFATRQNERIRRLTDQGIFSREQLDQADQDTKARNGALRADEAAVESAKAAVHADDVSVSNARLNLNYCKIVSPVTGRTGNLLLKQGNLVKANDAELISIYEIHPIYVTFSVPEAQLPEIRRRMKTTKLPVTALIQDVTPDSAEGVLTFLDNAVDPATGTIKLKGTFENTTDKLWPGQFVNVRVRLRELPNTPVIPPSALQVGQSGEYVYVVKSDNTVEQRAVTISIREEEYLAVAQGLRAGETIVVDGQVRLTPGSKVKVGS